MTKYNKTSSSLLLSDFIKLKVLNLNLYRIKDHLNLVAALQFTLEYKKQQVEVVKIDAWFTASPPVQKKKRHGNTLLFNFYQSKKQHIIIM